MNRILLAWLLHMAFAQAQNTTYLTGLAQVLNNSGLTQLATVAAGVNSTTFGQQLLDALPTKNWTIFAPDDAACRFSYPIHFVARIPNDPFFSRIQ